MSKLPETFYIPSGFSFGAVSSGVKVSGKLDLALVVCDQPAYSFGAFTQNVVRASSVDWNQQRIGTGRAVVINSGNANACTGRKGEQDTETMAQRVAQQIGCSADDVFVMSTGIIGEHLPMNKIESGIEQVLPVLGRDELHVKDLAAGILTTDTFPKVVSKEFQSESGRYRILGVAKGAGMIGPNMATMLCVLMTDFPVGPAAQARFINAVEKSFNSISVDGHTSTSDQVILLAPQADSQSESQTIQFFEVLDQVCQDLAKLIPSDGEGAQHLITIDVKGDQSEAELKKVAKTIADSPLVKTAVFGADPNWGRIVSAAGYSGVPFNPEQTSLWVNGELLFQNGTPVKFDAGKVSQSIRDHFDCSIVLEIGSSDHGEQNSYRYWTSDLTYDYIKINAEYHT